MKIVDKLEGLKEYFAATRRVGHTTLMKEGTKNYTKDKFVLSWKKCEADFLEVHPSEVISLDGIDKLKGFNRPLVIDNGAMYQLLSETLQKIHQLEEENIEVKFDNQQLQSKITAIKNVLNR